VKYLLDANIVSDARRGAATPVDGWVSARPVGDLAISSITLMELEVGIRRKERADPAAGAHLRRWLDGHVLPIFAGRILPVDAVEAVECARLHVPDPMPDMDALIAATALAHGLTLVTGNTKDFLRTGAAPLNPRELRSHRLGTFES
jgi:predicted nucleic acid-binding protein